MIYRWKESCAQPQQSLKTLCFSSWTGRSSSNRNPSFNCITLFRSQLLQHTRILRCFTVKIYANMVVALF